MNICEYLKKNEMTVTALALKIGISDSSLRNLIRGGSISKHIIEKVQKLGLNVDGRYACRYQCTGQRPLP